MITPTVADVAMAYSCVPDDDGCPGSVIVSPVGNGKPSLAVTEDFVPMYAGPVPVHEIATVHAPGGTNPMGSAVPDSVTGAGMSMATATPSR
jgi:hypothetical protein